MAANPVVKLVGVGKSYPSTENSAPLAVLDGINLEIQNGESLAIVGPSGSGKSTLLNIIGTLDRATAGDVFLGGENLNQLDEKQIAEIRNRHVGFVFQAHHLLPQCSVLENVLVPSLASDDAAFRQRAAARAEKLLERVGLAARKSHRPGQLSGGERQRVAVVRALINQPRLLLADEPTGALDRAAAEQLGQLLVELNREEDVTLLVVTHAPGLAGLMQRQFELRDGHLQAAAG